MSELVSMHLISMEEYEKYITEHALQVQEIEHGSTRKRNAGLGPPLDYEMESTTVWSFPDRGNWATHEGSYRGNWSPYVPRNLILKYTKEGDTVLDQMCGSGTTLIECGLLNRNGIGVDINSNSAMVSFGKTTVLGEFNKGILQIYVGDARNLNKIEKESIDLIATHPPYAGIIPYSRRQIDGDLSALSVRNYIVEMNKVAGEAYRVLKQDKYCSVLVGDTRKGRHYISIAFSVMSVFLNAGFLLKEDIIKLQWNMKGTRERWRGKSYDFYKIAHEHLFIFRKPRKEEDKSRVKLSSSYLLSELGIKE